MTTLPVREDELHAYVDERLAPARRAEVEAVLQEDAALRRRVAAWRRQREGLAEAFAFKAREPVPATLGVSRLIEQRASQPMRLRVAAAVALALVLGAAGGGAGGWVLRGRQRPGEIARIGIEATTAYRVFAADMMRPVEMDAANREELIRWISRRLGRPIDVPDLSRLGYRFMGGRVVAAALGPAALLMYEDNQGGRITVFVLPMHGAMTEPLQPIQANAAGGYAWINNRVGYGVVSGPDSPDIERLAEEVRTEMH
jgi:anti-sigma factor RsiW